MVDRVFFECRLDGPALPVDVGVGFATGEGTACSASERIAFAGGLDDSAAACLRRWFEGRLVPRLGRIWVCVDTAPLLGPAPAAVPTTRLYGDLTATQGLSASASGGGDAACATACQWVEVVQGRRLSVRQRSEIARCCGLLPARGCLHGVAVAPGRAPTAVRLCVAGLGARGATTWLAAMRVRCTEAIRDCVEEVSRPTRLGSGPALLHIDVGTELGDRIGLEFKLREDGQERGALAASGFLDWLTASGLCTATRRRALVEWPGLMPLPPAGASSETAVRKTVNSIKVAVDSTGITAKAYLMHRVHRRGRV